MKTSRLVGLIGTAALVLTVGATLTQASDPTAVYAKIDRVVLEPNAESPQAIQVWGVFSLAKPDDRTDYLEPARGYLYFMLAGSSKAARAEWADLKQVAGSGQIVSFGSRYQLKARLRKADERPASPDAYSVNVGLIRVRGRTDYAPVRALVEFRD